MSWLAPTRGGGAAPSGPPPRPAAPRPDERRSGPGRRAPRQVSRLFASNAAAISAESLIRQVAWSHCPFGRVGDRRADLAALWRRSSQWPILAVRAQPSSPPSQGLRRELNRCGWHRSVSRVAVVAGTSLLTGLITVNRGILVLVSLVFLIMLCGVVLPAVWSKHKSRRSSALEVLRVLRGGPSLLTEAEQISSQEHGETD